MDWMSVKLPDNFQIREHISEGVWRVKLQSLRFFILMKFLIAVAVSVSVIKKRTNTATGKKFYF